MCLAATMPIDPYSTDATSLSLVIPESEPALAAGCERNEDCPDYDACHQRLCINPCAEDRVCAPSANCRVARHQAVCTCPDGYIGTPEVDCKLRKQAGGGGGGGRIPTVILRAIPHPPSKIILPFSQTRYASWDAQTPPT